MRKLSDAQVEECSRDHTYWMNNAIAKKEQILAGKIEGNSDE